MTKVLFCDLPIFIFTMIILANLIALVADIFSPLYMLLILPQGVLLWFWASSLNKKHCQEVDNHYKTNKEVKE